MMFTGARRGVQGVVPGSLKRAAGWGIAVLLVLGMGWVALHGDELAEALKVLRCASGGCHPQSTDQLREQVLKAYLHQQLTQAVTSREVGGNNQLVILPRDLDGASLKQSVLDSSLLAKLTTDALTLSTHDQIDRLDFSNLASQSSIAMVSLTHRTAAVVPIKSLRVATADEVRAYAAMDGGGAFHFSRWERLRGYGQRFFWISAYAQLSLACCDGRGDDRGLSPDWLTRNTLTSIDSTRERLLAVSDQGAILIRHVDGDAIYLF